MTYRDFLLEHETAHPFDWNERLSVFVETYQSHRASRGGRPLRLLDVGCGRDAHLAVHVDPRDRYTGCDYYAEPRRSIDRYVRIDLNEDRLTDKLGDEQFDVVFCGEVIEHLFSPDALMDELRLVLDDDGILILSTPNLGYYANRLLLLVGISPLFLENSSRRKLGRRTRLLGQGNPTEGHVRLFTYRALLDFVQSTGFEVVAVTPTLVWKFPLDRVVCRFSRSLAPDNVLVLRKGTCP
jgi:SAM-dependent methyltransferase